MPTSLASKHAPIPALPVASSSRSALDSNSSIALDSHPITISLDIELDELPDQSASELNPVESAVGPTGRPKCTIRVPAYLENYSPMESASLKMSQYASLFEKQSVPSPASPSPSQHSSPEPVIPDPTLIKTLPNEFGVYWICKEWPSQHPEQNLAGIRLGDAPNLIGFSGTSNPLSGFGPDTKPTFEWYSPFSNPTSYHLTK